LARRNLKKNNNNLSTLGSWFSFTPKRLRNIRRRETPKGPILVDPLVTRHTPKSFPMPKERLFSPVLNRVEVVCSYAASFCASASASSYPTFRPLHHQWLTAIGELASDIQQANAPVQDAGKNWARQMRCFWAVCPFEAMPVCSVATTMAHLYPNWRPDPAGTGKSIRERDIKDIMSNLSCAAFAHRQK